MNKLCVVRKQYIPNSKRDLRGVTLVELLLALVLGVILVGAVVLTYLASASAAQDAERISRMQENVRILSEYLVRDIRNAGFRDETSLKIGHEVALRKTFAGFDPVTEHFFVRYAGRGHCAQVFEEFRLVENRYYVVDGELRCAGRDVPNTDPGTTFFSGDPEPPGGVTLVTGVRSLDVTPICAGNPGTCSCEFDFNDEDDESNPYLINTCIGVRLILELDGIENGPSDLSLLAAFRNVIQERINNDVWN